MLARKSVTFTQPSAILGYELEPVPGWFITQTDITGEVRVINLDFKIIVVQLAATCMHCLKQILKEEIDYRNLITQTPGNTVAEAAHALQELEKINEYPPRLSLQIARSKHAREHLKTKVIVKGVNPLVKFVIFGQCPG